MNKRFYVLSLLVAVVFALFSPTFVEARSSRSSPSDVYVHGYTRSNGTYVAPYYRTAPDSSISNNYGCIDNGVCGGGGYSGSYGVKSAPVAPSAPSCVSNSFYNGSACVCNAGYAPSSDRASCVTVNTVNIACIQKYGSRSFYNSVAGVCYCGSGDYYDASSDSCVMRPVVPTPVAVVSAPVVQPQVSQCQNGTFDASDVCICNEGFGYSAYLGNCIALAKRTIQKEVAKTTAVTNRRANVRTLPSLKGKVLGVTSAGGKYGLAEIGDGWVKVQFGNETGWILKSLVVIK